MRLTPSFGTTIECRPFEPVRITLTISSTNLGDGTLEAIKATEPEKSNPVTVDSPKRRSKAYQPWIASFLWTNIPNNRLGIHSQVWHPKRLEYAGMSPAGDLLFQILLFAPTGSWEVTAFVIRASDALQLTSQDYDAPTRCVWASGFGHNLKIVSSWLTAHHSALPALPRRPSGVFEPISPSDVFSTAHSTTSDSDSITQHRSSMPNRRCLATPAPWFVGNAASQEEATCVLMSDAIATLLTSPDATRSHTTLYNALLGTLVCGALMHHTAGTASSVPIITVQSSSLVIGNALLSLSSLTKTRIIGLVTGYTGERVNDILKSLEDVSKQAAAVHSSNSVTSLPLTSSHPDSDSVMSVLTWAFVQTPGQLTCMGSASTTVSHLSLDLADAIIEAHITSPQLAGRVMHLLIGMLSITKPSPHHSLHVTYATTIIEKLLAWKPSSPSPLSVRDPMLTSAAQTPNQATEVRDLITSAFQSAVSAAVCDITAGAVHTARTSELMEVEPAEPEVLPLEVLMKLLTRIHNEQHTHWLRTHATKRSAPMSPSRTPPITIRAAPRPSPPLPCVGDKKVLAVSTVEKSSPPATPPCGSPVKRAYSPPHSLSTPECTGMMADMWLPITRSIARLLTRIPPTLRDGDLRQEYHSVVTAIVQLCKWPTLLSAALDVFCKSWPKGNSLHQTVLVDLLLAMMDNYNKLGCSTDYAILRPMLPRLVSLLLRCAEGGAVDLSKQCLIALSGPNTSYSSAAAVNRSALCVAFGDDGVYLRDTCTRRLNAMSTCHWNASVRETALGTLLSYPVTMVVEEHRKYPPLPESPVCTPDVWSPLTTPSTLLM